MSGGLTPRRKGDRFEVEVEKDQERMLRRAARLRQGGGEIWDVWSIEACTDAYCSLYKSGGATHTYFIQCRLRGNLSAVEDETCAEDARLVSAIPLLAWKVDGQIRYRRLG